jgi:tetratricopeptide (TPR) repeat protein
VVLIPAPAIFVAGRAKPITVRGLGRVLLFLVFLQGKSVNRTYMAHRLWPGEPDGVAANRLRVSLNRLKAILGHSLASERENVRLVGASVKVDVWNAVAELRDALDEIEPPVRLARLVEFGGLIRATEWRAFVDLDTSRSLTDWEDTCHEAMLQMAETASALRDWDRVDLAWAWMRDRGDLVQVVCEQFLNAHHQRGTLEGGLQELRKAVRALDLDENSEFFQSLKSYAEELRERKSTNPVFDNRHFQLVGTAVLSQLGENAHLLSQLMASWAVQLHMQSSPAVCQEVLGAVKEHLEEGSAGWIDVEYCRMVAYASVYDSAQVIEISERILGFDMPPLRMAGTLMNYSFCLFQVRRWDDALAAVRRAQDIAKTLADTARLEVCVLTEAAYHWHLGEVDKARQIYDAYIHKHKDSTDMLISFNCAVVRSNYAIIELVFGDVVEARRHLDTAYAARTKINLSRVLPNLASLMGLVYGRTGEISRGVEFAIEGLKLTYDRGSSREGQINMEWASGLLVLGGLRREAWEVMRWIDAWRERTVHTRSVCERRYELSLALGEFDGQTPMLRDSDEYRHVLKFLVKGLRRVQAETQKTRIKRSAS